MLFKQGFGEKIMCKKVYSIEINDLISVTRFSQEPTLSEIKSAIDDVAAMGEFRKRLWIFDAGIDLRTDEIVEIGQYSKEMWSEPSVTAIVVPDDFSFGLARMYDAFREQEGVKSMVFRTESEAMDWFKK